MVNIFRSVQAIRWARGSFRTRGRKMVKSVFVISYEFVDNVNYIASHVSDVSNHYRRRAGFRHIMIYDIGYSNWNITDTGEDFLKSLVSRCSATVNLSAGMQHVNKDSKWREVHTIETGAVSLHMNKINSIVGLMLNHVL